MKKILPLLLVLLGLGGGVGAGLALKPKPELPDCIAGDEGCEAPAAKDDHGKDAKASKPSAYADLKRQFVVPILRDRRVSALVVASLAVEVAEGSTEEVFAREPKLRDAFLQVLFLHAHAGGFDGVFTARAAMDDLKTRLVEVAQPILGDALRDVLITEIVRQDM